MVKALTLFEYSYSHYRSYFDLNLTSIRFNLINGKLKYLKVSFIIVLSIQLVKLTDKILGEAFLY